MREGNGDGKVFWRRGVFGECASEWWLMGKEEFEVVKRHLV